MSKGVSVAETLKGYDKADPEEWRLLAQYGTDEQAEIKLREISQYIESEFMIALRWWQRYRKHGVPAGDWRELTIAQARVIDIFDDMLGRVKAI